MFIRRLRCEEVY